VEKKITYPLEKAEGMWYKYSADAKEAMHIDKTNTEGLRRIEWMRNAEKQKSKKNKKLVDKPLVRWYYMQAVARQYRTLIIEQYKPSLKFQINFKKRILERVEVNKTDD
jgi:hypothetical protein